MTGADDPTTSTGAPEPRDPGEPDVGPSATGWAQPPAQGGGMGLAKGCAIAAAIVVAVGGVLFTLAVVALIFLGGQVASILQGTVQFGTGGIECSVTGQSTTFPSTSTIHLAAQFERTVSDGEVVTMVVTGPDDTSMTRDEPPMTSDVTCISLDIPAGSTPGAYVIEFTVGSELLATGSVVITP